MRAQAASSGANAASWADARQAALMKGRSAEQLQRPLPGDGVSGIEQCLGWRTPGSVPIIARNVSVSAEGADIVVRIELVGAAGRRMRMRRTIRLGRRLRLPLASCCKLR